MTSCDKTNHPPRGKKRARKGRAKEGRERGRKEGRKDGERRQQLSSAGGLNQPNYSLITGTQNLEQLMHTHTHTRTQAH